MSRRFLRLCSAALMVLMLAGAGTAVASRVLGLRVLVEHSDSMYPAIATGDLVLSRDVPAARVRVGDIVTFPDPGDSRRTMTHRITQVQRSGRFLKVTTLGDANTGVEEWTALDDTTLGRTEAVVPRLGWIVGPLRSPAVAATLNGVLIFLLVFLVLRRRRSPAVPSRR